VGLEKEIERGWKLLEGDLPVLAKKGGIAMKFIVENDRESAIVYVPNPAIINDADLKGDLAKKVRNVVRRMMAHTIYHFSDAWTSAIQDGRNRPELIRKINEVGIDRASKMGLIVKREALICSISTRRGENAMLTWFYRRGPEDEITMEERRVIEGQAKGRFSALFEKDNQN